MDVDLDYGTLTIELSLKPGSLAFHVFRIQTHLDKAGSLYYYKEIVFGKQKLSQTSLVRRYE